MGSGKGGGSAKISPLEQALASQSTQLFDSTAPLRESMIGQYKDLLSGNYNFKNNPMYFAMFNTAKTGIEDQYGNARENILSSTPRGGGLTKALSNLEIGRASDMGTVPLNLTQQIATDMTNRAYGAGWNAPGQAMSGMSSAAGTYGNRLASEQASNAMGKAGMGQGIGNILGGYTGSNAGSSALAGLFK